MERAVVLIGVGHATGMPELPAVDRGIQAMQAWAAGQGLSAGRVTTLTDAAGPVTFDDVFKAVNDFAKLRTIEQLVVHFCGHGLVVDGNAVWLLSGATSRIDQAVNVAQSKYQAESGPFPHVVLISDACRTLPSTIGDASITGSSIFATGKGAARRLVDLLFATQRGAAALQVATPTSAEGPYTAVYTDVLAEALQGDYPQVLEQVDDELGCAQLVRLGPLYDALPRLVESRLKALNSTAFQKPDGAVLWDSGKEWISRLPRSLPGQRSDDADEQRRGVEGLPPSWSPEPDPLIHVAREAAQRLMDLPPPSGSSGVWVVGAEVDFIEEQIEPPGPWPKFGGLHMIRLASGRTAFVPTSPLAVTVVVFEGDQLVDVSFGGRDGDGPMPEARAWMGAASRYLLPWWGNDSIEEMLWSHLSLTEQDPTAAVLLAHALIERGRQDLVRELLTVDSLLDVALLAGRDSWDARGVRVPQGIPLYSRTWSLLGRDGLAPRPETPPRVVSPWTLFAGHINQSDPSIDLLFRT